MFAGTVGHMFKY